MMIGDVTVVGLDVSTVVLGDIGMDVPHQVVVTVPADLATRSKDLWRAVNQRRLFQLHAGSARQHVVRPVVPPTLGADKWQEKCRALEAENASLLERITALEQEVGRLQSVTPSAPPPPVPTAPVPVLDPRLDEILSLLKSGTTAPAPVGSARPTPTTPVPSLGVVEVEVPAFIPSEIKPKGVEGRIAEVQSETSANSNLGSAASALRKFRKGS